MTRPLPEQKPVRRDSMLWVSPRVLVVIFLVWILTRWYMADLRQLVPDEAYYWTWSRHIAASYFDHPPMVAYLIRLSTLIFGVNALGVRALAGIVTALAVLILTLTTRRLIGEGRAWMFVPLALLFSPLICTVGLIVTPDTPGLLFQSAALATVLLIFKSPQNPPSPSPCTQGEGRGEGEFSNDANQKNPHPNPLPEYMERGKEGSPLSGDKCDSLRRAPAWLLFGLFIGLALDSKYTAILLVASVFLALISCKEGRRHLLTIWPWLGAVIAAVVFSPVIYWNGHHQWASFLFQLRHGMGSAPEAAALPPLQHLARALLGFLGYVGGQTLVATPILFGFCLFVIYIYLRRRNNPMHVRILLSSALLPLIFFAYSSLHKRVEGNWPMFAYIPGVMLIARYLSENWTRRRVFWAEVAIKVAVAVAMVIHFPELALKISPKLGVPQWDSLFRWSDLAARVDSYRQGSPVVTGDYEYAAELQFYLPDHPDIRPFHDSSRLTAFDFFPSQPLPQSFDRVVLVRSLPRGFAPSPSWKPLGLDYTYSTGDDLKFYEMGRQVRRSLILVATR